MCGVSDDISLCESVICTFKTRFFALDSKNMFYQDFLFLARVSLPNIVFLWKAVSTFSLCKESEVVVIGKDNFCIMVFVMLSITEHFQVFSPFNWLCDWVLLWLSVVVVHETTNLFIHSVDFTLLVIITPFRPGSWFEGCKTLSNYANTRLLRYFQGSLSLSFFWKAIIRTCTTMHLFENILCGLSNLNCCLCTGPADVLIPCWITFRWRLFTTGWIDLRSSFSTMSRHLFLYNFFFLYGGIMPVLCPDTKTSNN